ncbi:MAG: hypothetical protein QHH19_05000 [Candidatus Thermoplasmatota archaeon]|jgi:hypothetical protein|nr:hypothetical protein [Candidatus Thermoplasmatota archaeon]
MLKKFYLNELIFSDDGDKERMGKIEGGEERFNKKTPVSPPFARIYIIYQYINLIIQISTIDVII